MLSVLRGVVSLLLSLLISIYGVRRRSLDLSGGLAAVVVGFVLTASNGSFCLALLAFFFSSSKLTKWKAKEKRRLEQDYKEGGQRNWIQVLCNGGVALAAAVCYIWYGGECGERPFHIHSPSPPIHTLAALACLASLSCCCGDTWASEVGSVMGGTPRLITSWRKVPPGTNGGVTLVGILCSWMGGVFVGVAYYFGLWVLVGFSSLADAWIQGVVVIVLGGVAGLFGSLVDSLLGATVQYSGYSEREGRVVHSPRGHDGHVKHISGLNILDNHAVNFFSSAITAIVLPLTVWFISHH